MPEDPDEENAADIEDGDRVDEEEDEDDYDDDEGQTRHQEYSIVNPNEMLDNDEN